MTRSQNSITTFQVLRQKQVAVVEFKILSVRFLDHFQSNHVLVVDLTQYFVVGWKGPHLSENGTMTFGLS